MKEREVYCQGCQKMVKRSLASFVIWGEIYCYFCNRCMSIIKKAKEEGRSATPEDLRA